MEVKSGTGVEHPCDGKKSVFRAQAQVHEEALLLSFLAVLAFRD